MRIKSVIKPKTKKIVVPTSKFAMKHHEITNITPPTVNCRRLLT